MTNLTTQAREMVDMIERLEMRGVNGLYWPEFRDAAAMLRQIIAEREVIDRVRVARKAVFDWMEAEGKAGRIRHNGQAPGWSEYEEADAEFQALVVPQGGMNDRTTRS